MRASSTLEALRSAGLRARIVPVTRLPDIERDIVSLLENGSLDRSFFEAELNGLRFSPPDPLPDARSIIVVAVPVPKFVLKFTWKGNIVPLVVPPTYTDARKIMDMVKGTVSEATGNSTAKFERAVLPLKTLAARTGLVRYGRNNITYLEGSGSFHRLVALYTDIDLETDDWQEREMLPACKTCRMCLKACPVSAIVEERFLIHADRCLTYFNEMPSDRAFPAAVKADSHNALIGCMKCQDVCPYDRRARDWAEDGETFTEEETEFLLSGDLEGKRPDGMCEKLGRHGLDLTTFPRNLEVLLKGP
ncbi:MAG: 4Fe-4S double cluster binding domain-containing protein [Methanomassiliicoccales archaeon]|jgi:epoxyqueuosine reductase